MKQVFRFMKEKFVKMVSGYRKYRFTLNASGHWSTHSGEDREGPAWPDCSPGLVMWLLRTQGLMGKSHPFTSLVWRQGALWRIVSDLNYRGSFLVFYTFNDVLLVPLRSCDASPVLICSSLFWIWCFSAASARASHVLLVLSWSLQRGPADPRTAPQQDPRKFCPSSNTSRPQNPPQTHTAGPEES